ncbi:ATP-binding protein, partial [Oceanispirochaeta sp.]|uniref:sensor histidine kinase n=1 Tax=Oceanispirochaeta sp. TaxID=2035350 RepID=UPI00260E2081
SVSYWIEEAGTLIVAFILFAIAAALLLTGLVFLIVSIEMRQYQVPIRKLLKLTADAARGGISKINVDTSSTELAQLVENFNSLVDRYTTLTESDNKKYSRINTLLSNLKTGILMLDKDNAVTLVNPRAEDMLNLNKLSLFNVRNTSDSHNDNFEKILKISDSVNQKKESSHIILTTPGARILDVSVEAVYNKYKPYEHSGALVILRDVTEMRRLEQLKDDFVANVSHELRTPLTLINGFVETLKSWKILSDDDRQTALNIIEVETERLKKLINELLLLSRIEGDMTEATRSFIDAPGIIRDVVKALEPLRIEKDISLELDLQETEASYSGVISWYRQIVFNLYHNALKYSPEAGHIHMSLKEEKGFLVLTVSDDGVGIPVEEQEKIFDRFYRVEKYQNRKISGSGLGLTITKHMVVEFGGTIDLHSEEGRGSSFNVRIPSDQLQSNRSPE